MASSSFNDSIMSSLSDYAPGTINDRERKRLVAVTGLDKGYSIADLYRIAGERKSAFGQLPRSIAPVYSTVRAIDWTGSVAADPVTAAAWNTAAPVGTGPNTGYGIGYNGDLAYSTAIQSSPFGSGNACRVFLDKNMVNAPNVAGCGVVEFPGTLGSGSLTKLALEYDLYMENTSGGPFDFGQATGINNPTWNAKTYAGGGKLPGIVGVLPGVVPDVPTGGSGAPTQGFSVRFMWVTAASYPGQVSTRVNRVYPYAYHPGQIEQYGDNLWSNVSGLATSDDELTSNTVNKLRMELELNTVTAGVGDANGKLRAYRNGKKIYDVTNFVYRNDASIFITHFCFSVFRGGNAVQTWFGDQPCYVWIDNIKMETW